MSSDDLFESLIADIQSGNTTSVESKIGELSEEQLNALFGKVQPYKSLGSASSDKFVLGSVINLREKYLKKLITTAMVGFLFQMQSEYTVDEEDLETPPNKDDFYEEEVTQTLPENYNTSILFNEELDKMYKTRFPNGKVTTYKEMEALLSEDDLLEVSSKVNERYNELTKSEKVFNSIKYNEALEDAVSAQSEKEQVVIKRFLEWLFKYDENKHVAKGNNEVNGDSERQNAEELKGTDTVYDNIPPNDTHCRFNAYYDINYEKLRDATKNIYNVKPDLEHAMIIYDVVNKKEDVDAFIHKYGANSGYDILSFGLNQWTLMGPFKENRDRVDYYNKHNSIIKSMLDQQEADNKLREELMKKRIKSKKIKAEKVFGKDSPGFDEYKKLSPSELENKYNAKMEELEDGSIKITREINVNAETGEELTMDDDGVPSNALEVPITTINARTGESSQTRIFTQSTD